MAGIEIDKEWQMIKQQYELNRAEQLNKKDKLFKITVLGVGGIATLAGIVYQYQLYALFLIIPLLILTSLLVYGAECNAVINMSNYEYELEQRYILTERLGWEKWLRSTEDGNKRLSYYLSELGSIFILLVLFVWSIGLIYLERNRLPQMKIAFVNSIDFFIIMYVLGGIPSFYVAVLDARRRYGIKRPIDSLMKFFQQLLKGR